MHPNDWWKNTIGPGVVFDRTNTMAGLQRLYEQACKGNDKVYNDSSGKYWFLTKPDASKDK